MSKNPEKKSYTANIGQLRALASPVRIEIVGVFQTHGPLAIRELAEKMSRPADGLYHHVRQLLKVEILRVAETRRAGKRDEAVFELTAERFGHTAQPKTSAMKHAIVETAASALRLANREFRRAVLADRQAEDEGRTRAKLSRQRTWLTDEDLVDLHGLLEKIEAFLKRRTGRKQGRPFALTTVLVPIVKRKRI
jgi:helix-turn-helix protein